MGKTTLFVVFHYKKPNCLGVSVTYRKNKEKKKWEELEREYTKK
ncbi:MAG: hypothetical protein U9Q92_05460 [archaeon]|nr:hypothetical protein [archaeon]